MAQVRSLETGKKFKDTPIGKIPVDWEIRTVDDIGEIITGSTPSTRIKEYYGDKYMFVTPTDISNYKYVKTTARMLSNKGLEVIRKIPKDSVMVVCIASIGKVALAYDDCSTNQQINSIICNKTVKPHFVYYLINSKISLLSSLSGTTAVPIVNKTQFSKILIPLPPLSEQKKISEILSTVDDAIEETDSIIEKTKELKKGMMHKLLTRGIGHKKFKKTETCGELGRTIGEIPKEWEVTQIGSIAKVKRGASPRPINDPKWFGGNVGWVRISDVTNSNKYLTRTKDYLSDDGVEKSVRIKKGEVILSICATIGRPIIINMDACIHDGFVWFDGLNKDIDREFFYYLLQRNEQKLSGQRQTGTQGNLNTSIISDTFIPFPPLHEQKKIAEVLSFMDSEVEFEEKIKKALEFLKKSLMQVLLTGKVRVKTT